MQLIDKQLKWLEYLWGLGELMYHNITKIMIYLSELKEF